MPSRHDWCYVTPPPGVHGFVCNSIPVSVLWTYDLLVTSGVALPPSHYPIEHSTLSRCVLEIVLSGLVRGAHWWGELLMRGSPNYEKICMATRSQGKSPWSTCSKKLQLLILQLYGDEFSNNLHVYGSRLSPDMSGAQPSPHLQPCEALKQRTPAKIDMQKLGDIKRLF